MSEQEKIAEIHRDLQRFSTEAMTLAIMYLASGVMLAHANLYGIAGIWFRETAKLAGMCVALAIARDKVAEKMHTL